ncbi:MAG TPA: hypothetical protein VN673_00215, partial [Clostridia bacterium]|nr:hypothetical protein [Clostridia bacterium]
QAVLRFYGWTEPAASFGYFQKYVDVAALTPLRPLVRRPTAGGIVPHAADWTYSLAFPVSHPWYQLSAVESYRRVHEWIRAAFVRLALETVVAPEALKSQAGQCFIGYEQYDLLWRGRKIAGAAQRRTRWGLLIQGSVQPPTPSLGRADWQHAMRDCATAQERVTWEGLEPDPELDAEVRDLMAAKYSQTAYHRKR